MSAPVTRRSPEGRVFTDGLLFVIEFTNEYGPCIGRLVKGLLCDLDDACSGRSTWWPTDEAIRIRAAHATLLLQLSALKAEEQAHLLCIVSNLRDDDVFLGWLHLVLFGWGPSREGRQDRLALAHVRRVHGDMSTPRAYVFPLLVPGEDYGNIGIHKGGPQSEVLRKLRDAVTSRYGKGG